MKTKRAEATSSPGPLRWSYRSYSVFERATPFGRRFEVRSPKDELVLLCRAKRSEPRLVFFADDEGSVELFRFEPKKMPHVQRCYEAIDAGTGRLFGQVRKRVYGPLRKSEWFLHNADGDEVGLVTETAREPSLLRRLVPVERIFAKAWAIHWGQSIVGTIQPKAGIVGERLEVDLGLDKRDEIDRRLALGVTVAIRSDLHFHDDGETPA